MGKQLSDTFYTENALKQGDAFSPLHFNCVLEYSSKKAKDN